MTKETFSHALRSMLVMVAWLVAATATAQHGATVTLDLKETPLAVALQQVEKASTYRVLFSYDAVAKHRVTAKIIKQTAPEAVRTIVKGLPLAVTVKGKYITVAPTGKVAAANKEREVNGVVLDDIGEALLGATVSVPGTPYGTVTDERGYFGLTLPTDINEVTVTYVGMQPKKVTVATGRPITVSLAADASLLQDVIVTGYQVISKERSTGSFSKVTEKDLESKRLSSISNVLEGKVAGYNNGVIRGLSTMYGETQPLYVIDGFPIENQTMDYQGTVSTKTPDLNMDDIQDITILKDAAAVSIYGARAANGVIVITTKKGAKSEKLKVNVSASLAWKPYSTFTGNLLSSAEQIDLEREWAETNTQLNGTGAKDYAQKLLENNIYPNAGIRAILNNRIGNISEAQMNQTLDALAKKGYNYYDQADRLAKRDQLQQQYNISFAKTTDRNMFNASVTYKHNAYSDKYSNDQSVGVNLDNITKLTKWMSLETGAFMQFGQQKTQGYSVLSPGYTFLPYDDLVNADGIPYTKPQEELSDPTHLGILAKYPQLNDESITPLSQVGYNGAKENTLTLRTFARLNIDFTPWLKYTASFQYERGNNEYRQIENKESHAGLVRENNFKQVNGDGSLGDIIPFGDVLSVRDQYRKAYNFRQQLSFDYTIKDLHNITAIFGTETRENKLWMRKNTVYNYDDQKLTYSGVDEATLHSGKPNVFGGMASVSDLAKFYENKNRYVSVYGNAAYSYDGRYTANFSMRWDRSNLWGTSSKYQGKPIWSAGLSWNASNEKFMKEIKWVNMLKLRASYGIMGNVNPQFSPYMVTYSGFNYNIGDNQQYVSSRPNSDLSWEKTKTTNIGVDFALLQNRLRGTLDYYNKYGERLLSSTMGVPTEGYGYSTYAINNGEMRNRGFELSLQGDVIRTKDLTWTLNGILSLNQNKVMYVNVKAPMYALQLDHSDAYPIIGDQYGALYGYEWAGLNNEGMPQVYNEKGEKTTTAPTTMDAIKCIANAMPTYSGSFGTSLSWRGFDLNVLFTFEGGYKIRNANMPFLFYSWTSAGYVSKLNGLGRDIVNRWRQPGDEAHTDIPRACFTEAGLPLTSMYSTYNYSSANLLDASHIKLSNISLAYHLPKALLRKAFMQSARVQINIENPCLFAHSTQAKYQLGGYNAATYTLGVFVGL